MGASESTPSVADQDGPSSKSIQPYGLSAGSSYLDLNCSYRAFYRGIVGLVENNKYSDLVVICEDDRYPVHRAIICPRSTWFERKCEQLEHDEHRDLASPFKIWVDAFECESHIFAAVLAYLYTLDYKSDGPQQLSFGLPSQLEDDEHGEEDDTDKDGKHEDLDSTETESLRLTDDDACSANSLLTPTGSGERDSRSSPRVSSSATTDPGQPHNELVFHAQVYMAAKYFGIPPLCDISKEKFQKRLRAESWKTEMIGCIREIYAQANPGTSELAAIIAASTRSRFRTLKTMDGWNDLVLDFPEFAAEILRRL